MEGKENTTARGEGKKETGICQRDSLPLTIIVQQKKGEGQRVPPPMGEEGKKGKGKKRTCRLYILPRFLRCEGGGRGTRRPDFGVHEGKRGSGKKGANDHSYCLKQGHPFIVSKRKREKKAPPCKP